jgi:autophagy-related protein 16
VQLKQSLDEKTKALDLLIQEHQAVKAELEQALTKLKAAEDENQSLIDRWMLEKMKDAERLNEVPYFLFIVKMHVSYMPYLK